MTLRALLVRTFLAAVCLMAASSSALAQAAADSRGILECTISTQKGSVVLPGVLVRVVGSSDAQVAEELSDGEGHVKITLPPAEYHLYAALEGFQPADVSAVVLPDQVVKVTLDLAIATLTDRVHVVAAPTISSADTLAVIETVHHEEAELQLPGGGVQSALRLLPSIIEVRTGTSIDGGRPHQAGFQIQSASIVNPVTQTSHPILPSLAVDSVSVLANPYEVEFGRFSSGVVVVQTRRPTDRWRTLVDNLEPALRMRRFTLLQIQGIALAQPSMVTGGPLAGGRVSLEVAAQYHYETTDIPSRPDTELRTTQWFSGFSRADVKVSSRHSLLLNGGLFPNSVNQATLGTFTPPAATADISGRTSHAMASDRYILTNSALLESTVQFQAYRAAVSGQGTDTMELLPGTTLGNFFNQQRRDASSYQWIETLSGSHRTFGRLNLFKTGIDLLHSQYEGASNSGPILIARSDGTLSRRLGYDGPTVQSAKSTDVALFAQDRIQAGNHWYVELGGRLEHYSMIDDWAATPRVGVAVLLNDSGTNVLRGGFGLFHERTPLVAGAFEQFEAALDTRFDTDGITPLGPPTLYEHVTAPDLKTARSATWDASYDHRLNRMLSMHIGVLDREGSQQPIVDPVRTEQDAELLLSSTGRSSYHQVEAAIHLTGSRADADVTYTRSSAREDLNALVDFFDVVLAPIIGANAYAPAAADAPNRLFVRAWAKPARQWLVLGTLDWRSGLPYSIVNDALDFVGARNKRRFPSYARLDAGIDRRITIGRMQPWLGLRVTNALNSFLPSDVQANLGSPGFGSFYNSVYREYRIHLRFEH